MSEARVDKWLWAARLFKTRSLAAEACKKGQIAMRGTHLKPSRSVKVGDILDVRKPPITYSFKIKQTIEKRIGAKLVSEVLEDVTPASQYELLEISKISGFVDRARGSGRPTKKDRRSLEDFTAPEFQSGFEFDLDDEA